MAVLTQCVGMARPSAKHEAFTRTDCRRLGRALAAADRARVYRRLAAVLAVADGQSVGAAARQARADRTTVHRWVDRYLATRDPNALADDVRPGRPRVRGLTDRRLMGVLALDPRTRGYHAATWTAPLLATYCAEQFDCAVSPRTLRRRLHALGFRWKRPRYRYAHRATHLPQKKGLSAVA
jgi:transposase